MSSLFGFNIRVSPCLAGLKKAVKQGDTFFVSPAMWDLMEHADEAELKHLLNNIHFIGIGMPLDIFNPPMITTNPFERGW